MTSTHTQIKVVGLYSPKANEKAFEQFITQYIDDADPANFNEETVAIFKRLNREIVPYNDDDKLNLRDDLNHRLGKAVYVELLVEQPDQNFVMIDFYQQDPKQKEGYGQVAWNEAYLTEDGEHVIASYPVPKIPEMPIFRVVFVIHDWIVNAPLHSPYGVLNCPVLKSLPERLWRLAPYQMVD